MSEINGELTSDQLIGAYVQLRDKVDSIKKQQTEALVPYRSAMNRIETTLLDRLNEEGAEAFRAKSGTAFKHTKTSVTCNAFSATLEYIKEHDAWELLEARVSPTAAQAIIEETKQDIPGVVVRREIVLSVRRPT